MLLPRADISEQITHSQNYSTFSLFSSFIFPSISFSFRVVNFLSYWSQPHAFWFQHDTYSPINAEALPTIIWAFKGTVSRDLKIFQWMYIGTASFEIHRWYLKKFMLCRHWPNHFYPICPLHLKPNNPAYLLGETVSLLVVTNTNPSLSLVCKQLPHPLLWPSHPFTPCSSSYTIYIDDINNNLSHLRPRQIQLSQERCRWWFIDFLWALSIYNLK